MDTSLIMELIFFTDGTKFKSGTRNCAPIPCELKDGRNGYYLGDDWKETIEGRGIATEPITFDDIKQPEIE